MFCIPATRRLALAILGLGSAFAVTAVAIAQQSPAIGDEITVQSTRYAVRSEPATRQVVGSTESGIPISQVEIIHHVRFDDLDLKTESGAQDLRRRVESVAASGCRNLDGFNPALTTERECVVAAVKAAQQQIEAAVAKARRAG
jgi:UrcA family protein